MRSESSEDEEKSEDAQFREPFVRRLAQEYTDRRGSYDRASDGVKRRLSFAQYAFEHRRKVETNGMGVPCLPTCPYGQKCWMAIPPAVLLNAHVRIYGAWAACDSDGKYTCASNQADANEQHAMLMLSWLTLSATDPPKVTENYAVEGRGPVCCEFAKAAYDMSRCWYKLYSAASKGVLRVGDARSGNMISRAMGTGRDDQAQFECVMWHVMWLRLEDQVPNEPVILHRNVQLQSVHEMEYVPDIKWFGTAEPLSLTRWYALRKPALTELSIEYFGDVQSADINDGRLSPQQIELKLSGGGFGVPVQMLKLYKRAKHSNFGQCDGCAACKQKWADHRKRPNRTLGDEEAIKSAIFKHVYDVQRERKVAERWMQECVGRVSHLFTLDDKCGSQFLHLPSPAGGRFKASEVSRWQYRFGMHVNILDGELVRLSMVPPCLKTGVNFGNSAFFASISRAHELGVLGSDLFRQTDSGPDIDAREAHALHIELVSIGAVNNLTWLRLMPKHSHNKCDRVNSMVKERIWPESGTGGGCMAPWDMEKIMQDAVKSQKGRFEFAMHWVNLDWRARYNGLFCAGFEGYGAERLWKYEYDPSLPPLYVRVTYQENLLPREPNSREPDMLPCRANAHGELITMREGLEVLKSLPAPGTPYSVEPWKYAETSDAEGLTKRDAWHRKKVMGDIREHTAPSFPAAQQDQWAALDAFHTQYPTSDVVPNVPFSMPGETNSWHVPRGTPMDWHAAFCKLTLRHNRYNRAPMPNMFHSCCSGMHLLRLLC